jgi:hypothetical protein
MGRKISADQAPCRLSTRSDKRGRAIMFSRAESQKKIPQLIAVLLRNIDQYLTIFSGEVC